MESENLKMQDEDSLESIMLRRFLRSSEMKQMVRDIVIETQQGLKKEHARELTRKQLSELWQISVSTIDRLTDEELKAQGFRRKKIGVSVRFEFMPVADKDT